MLFHSFWNDFEPTFNTFPALNVYKNADNLVVAAEIPGVHPENLDISIKDDVLTLSGTRQFVSAEEGQKTYRNEISEGKFSRNVRLPYPVDADKVDASAKDGILTIKLAIAEKAKARKITVKADK